MSPSSGSGDIDVNLSGAFRVVQACLAGMRERRWGRIVVISSGAARDGLPGQVAYSASKAGLIGMVKTVAAENARRGITANAVLPGHGRDRERARRCPPRSSIASRRSARRADGRARRGGRPGRLPRLRGRRLHHAARRSAIDGGAGLNTMSLARIARRD